MTPSTVAKAYQELERQKVIETIRAKGTFIAQSIQLKQDEEKVDEIRKRMRSEIMELKLMGYESEEIIRLVMDVFNSLK